MVFKDLKYLHHINYTIFERKWEQIGLPFWIFLTLYFLVYPFILESLHDKTEWSHSIIAVLGVAVVLKLQQNFTFFKMVQQHYLKKTFLAFQSSIMLMYASPYLAQLIYHRQWLWSMTLSLFIFLLVNFKLPKTPIRAHMTLPISVGQFEFQRGFRMHGLPILTLFIFLGIAMRYANVNLALSALFLYSILIGAYFQYLEPISAVWIYSVEPKAFLLRKIKNAIISYWKLYLPLAILQIVCLGWNDFFIVIPIYISFYLTILIVFKYACYPKELDVISSLTLVITLIFPPFSIYSLRKAWHQSIWGLSSYLE